MPRERWLLLAYLLTVLGVTLVHVPLVLALVLAAVLLLAGREAGPVLRRILRLVLLFNLAVSLGYGLLAWLQDFSPWHTLLLLNLRVLLLASLSFVFITRVNLFQALGFSRNLTWLLGLAYSQALSFRRAYEEFRLALRSRSLRPPRLIDRYRASAAAASWFLDKGLATARETALALRARGFFHD